MGAVLHGAWHDITHLDGRLWRTLGLLLFRPGRLTVDYFHERRARYLPPVRLYLVLSIAFFSFGIGSDGRGPGAAEAPSAAAAGEASRSPSVLDDLGADIGADLPCDRLQIAGIAVLERAARDACVRNRADRGRTFLGALERNIPRMMFLFLPLMAGVITPLYWRPRRYYVEHLVFLLHTQSAVFLCFLLQKLAGRIAEHWHLLAPLTGIGGFLLFLYVLWYPYAAMRRYYAQGRVMTAVKYMAVGSAYGVFLLLTLLGTALVTALATASPA